MRIAFLCGSFEPGRDGVGDYVAQLARGLTSLGHACQIVALADRYAQVPYAGGAEGFELVRVPAARWHAGEIAAAVASVDRFAPDWVSLQMVGYAYEERGLLLRSRRHFAAFAARARRHVMLHELWIGADAGSGERQRLVGAAQRWLLVRTLRSWAAHVTHTSNPVYRELLARAGLHAQLLPLPGNIPVVPTVPQRARELLAARAGLSGKRTLVAGVFGALHREWVEGAWLDALAAACEAREQTLALVHLGRAGAAGAALWSTLRARYGERVRFAALGELSAADVSTALQGLDLGIATTPWALVGKSGAVAAMLEHGVPVVVTRTDYRLRRGATPEPATEPGLHRFGDVFLEQLRRGEIERSAPRAPSDVPRRLLASFTALAAVPAATAECAPA
jgi:glycosyltransferase involved in cell wall biosynthesis